MEPKKRTLMLRISATASTYLKNRRWGILPRPQRVHRNCTPFLYEPKRKTIMVDSLITCDDEILSGTPVFKSTRVPIKT